MILSALITWAMPLTWTAYGWPIEISLLSHHHHPKASRGRRGSSAPYSWSSDKGNPLPSHQSSTSPQGWRVLKINLDKFLPFGHLLRLFASWEDRPPRQRCQGPIWTPDPWKPLIQGYCFCFPRMALRMWRQNSAKADFRALSFVKRTEVNNQSMKEECK